PGESQGSSNGVFVAIATKVVTPDRGGNAELGRWLRSEREHCVSPNPIVSAIGTRAHSSARRRKPRTPSGTTRAGTHKAAVAVTEAATPAAPRAREVSPAEAPALAHVWPVTWRCREELWRHAPNAWG